MTPAEAFRFGFLARCVEEGLSADETEKRAEKLASELEKRAFGGSAATAAKDLLKDTGMVTMLAAGLAPAAAYGTGRGLGYLTANITNDTASDYIERAKHEELTDEYDRRIQQIRKLQAARGLMDARKPSGRRVGF